MSGKAKSTVSGYSQFITIRNVDRGNLFYEEPDYHHCLCRLKSVTDYYGCFIHGYALMPDHFYLLLSAGQETGMMRAMKLLEYDYGRYFDFTHRRIHRKLELDYSMLPVTGHQLLIFCRYIELAPVRAALV
ncbi:MAG: transposase, partial [Gammaproteobacteria bacterium]